MWKYVEITSFEALHDWGKAGKHCGKNGGNSI
jgi:hypothetical protein